MIDMNDIGYMLYMDEQEKKEREAAAAALERLKNQEELDNRDWNYKAFWTEHWPPQGDIIITDQANPDTYPLYTAAITNG